MVNCCLFSDSSSDQLVTHMTPEHAAKYMSKSDYSSCHTVSTDYPTGASYSEFHSGNVTHYSTGNMADYPAGTVSDFPTHVSEYSPARVVSTDRPISQVI